MKIILNKNFYTWMKTVLLSSFNQSNTIVTNSNNGTGDDITSVLVLGTPLICIDGTELTSFNRKEDYHVQGENVNSNTLFAFAKDNIHSNNTNYTYFSFGTGSTAATENDTHLEAIISENLTYSLSGSHNETGDFFYITVLNTGTETISISEIGINKNFVAQNVMLGRVVLDNPVIVATNQSASFQIEIQL